MPLKLTASQVTAIRLDRRAHYKLAAEHGVCAGTIQQVRARKTWKHLPITDEERAADQYRANSSIFPDHPQYGDPTAEMRGPARLAIFAPGIESFPSPPPKLTGVDLSAPPGI